MTNHANRKKKTRQRARNDHLDRLFVEQNSLCHWCHRPTALTRYVPKNALVGTIKSEVRWRIHADLVVCVPVATVDHVIPLSEGGTNDPGNLVLACANCNKDRTSTPDPASRACAECGGDNPNRKSHCTPCYVRKTREWLVGLGWGEVPTHDGHSKFVDPVSGALHKLTAACKIQTGRNHNDALITTERNHGHTPAADSGRTD